MLLMSALVPLVNWTDTFKYEFYLPTTNSLKLGTNFFGLVNTIKAVLFHIFSLE